MKCKKIEISRFRTDIFNLWSKKWMLLTSGAFDREEFNTMTVGWGSIGIMWNRPFVQAVVRPTRYTFDFMERFDTFTLTAFPEEYRNSLSYLGRVSGKDEDKVKKSGLHPVRSLVIEAPGFEEAELTVECKKIYCSRFDPNEFIDIRIRDNYPEEDYHIVYFGEILNITGTDKYMNEHKC